MGFNHVISAFSASLIFFVKRSLRLIWSPYKTMRVISRDTDMIQVAIMITCIGAYFLYANNLKEYPEGPVFLFFLTIIHLLLTVLYFGVFALISKTDHTLRIRPFLLLFSYALLPTLVWFVVNSILFTLIPPPRTPSFLGKGFSLLYVSFSVGILMWKVIVTYLAVRFATGFRFFRILYLMILYLAIVIPYSLFLYSLHIFRIPFL